MKLYYDSSKAKWAFEDGNRTIRGGDSKEALIAHVNKTYKAAGLALPFPEAVQVEVTTHPVTTTVVIPYHKQDQKSEVADRDLLAKYRRYINKHPEVWDMVIELARKAKHSRRRQEYGMQAFLEIIRWERDISPDEDEAFKVSNDIAAYLSRDIMMCCEDLYGFFTTKACPADHEMGWLKFVERMEAKLEGKKKPATVGRVDIYAGDEDEVA